MVVIKFLVVAVALASVSVAHAAPSRLFGIKIGGQDPAVHRIGVLQRPLREREPALAACGTMAVPAMVGVTLSIAPEGSIADVAFWVRGFDRRSATLAEPMRACLTTHLRTVRYPARARASKLGFLLVYR